MSFERDGAVLFASCVFAEGRDLADLAVAFCASHSKIDYEPLSAALAKLLLDDAGVTVRKDTSVALGAGWRLGAWKGEGGGRGGGGEGVVKG